MVFPVPGRAGEAHVQVRPGRGQPEPLPRPVDQQQRADLRDLLLHRDEPDQLAVQRGEQVVDARLRPLRGEGDAGVRRSALAPLAAAPARTPRRLAAADGASAGGTEGGLRPGGRERRDGLRAAGRVAPRLARGIDVRGPSENGIIGEYSRRRPGSFIGTLGSSA